MSWLSKFLKKNTGVPEVKIPFGEMLLVNQVIEHIGFLTMPFKGVAPNALKVGK